MSVMLIPNKDQPSLYDEPPPDSLRSVARARTLTVLPRLAGDGKGRVVQFLHEAGLISSERAVLDLSNANLSEADLRGANLREADLSNTLLSEANLSEANLSEANLSGADLGKAVLGEANLGGADMS